MSYIRERVNLIIWCTYEVMLKQNLMRDVGLRRKNRIKVKVIWIFSKRKRSWTYQISKVFPFEYLPFLKSSFNNISKQTSWMVYVKTGKMF